MLDTVVLAAASVDTSAIDVGQFLQFGILGLIFVCVILRKYLVPEWTLKQQQDNSNAALNAKDEQIAALKVDKAELKESLDQLQELTRTEIIPALVRSNQLSAEYIAEVAENRGRHGQP